jgi:hypothetical protein
MFGYRKGYFVTKSPRKRTNTASNHNPKILPYPIRSGRCDGLPKSGNLMLYIWL